MSKVEANKKYILSEVVKPGTPEELALLGRTRAPGEASKQVLRIPYDVTRKTYDLGLTKKSKEFIGKSDKEITAILKERKPIIDAFEIFLDVDFSNVKDAEDKLNEFKVETYHGKVFDTSDHQALISMYVLNYIGKAVFQDVPKQGGEIYEISEDSVLVDREGIFIEGSSKLNSEFLSLLDTDIDAAINLLYLLGSQRVNKGTAKSRLIHMFKTHSESRELVLEKNKSIEKWELVSKIMNEDKDILALKAKIKQSMSLFEKASDGYYYMGKNIGKTEEEIQVYFSNNETEYSKLLKEKSR